ncbi:MAG: Druantia anti-phage system protein DruA [Candidatus Sedimenticola endophacoides]
MQAHHYLGAPVKIGNTIRYVAEREGRWVGLLSISASALKCAARDQWIGWGYRHQYDRLNMVAHNSRFVTIHHTKSKRGFNSEVHNAYAACAAR